MSALRQVRPATWGLLYLSLVALGLGLGWQKFRGERDLWARAQSRKAAVIDKVREAEAERAEMTRTLDRAAPDLDEVLRAYPPSSDWTLEAETQSDLALGIRRREQVVRFDDWGWEDVRRLVERTATQNPPWRLVEVDLRAGVDGLEGFMRMEALDKPANTP
ncbi:MAG: hypothetical protein JJU29_09950 [Verrucomicrobia bacterium]|nr:hypothetical protein [Verrucomicrobiota bacterium]MCH8512278.1 hypothetical protein [Kiritimatiellia bacterium]